MSLSHRPAVTADLEEICGFVQSPQELFFSYPRASWPLDIGQLAAAMAERRESTVAQITGYTAGFANFFQWQHGEYCTLGNLMVAPWARGKGVAHYLVEVMEELARQHYKAREMRVSCFNANAPALLLYPKLGYQLQQIVERSGPAGERVALIQFSKALRAHD